MKQLILVLHEWIEEVKLVKLVFWLLLRSVSPFLASRDASWMKLLRLYPFDTASSEALCEAIQEESRISHYQMPMFK